MVKGECALSHLRFVSLTERRSTRTTQAAWNTKNNSLWSSCLVQYVPFLHLHGVGLACGQHQICPAHMFFGRWLFGAVLRADRPSVSVVKVDRIVHECRRTFHSCNFGSKNLEPTTKRINWWQSQGRSKAEEYARRYCKPSIKFKKFFPVAECITRTTRLINWQYLNNHLIWHLSAAHVCDCRTWQKLQTKTQNRTPKHPTQKLPKPKTTKPIHIFDTHIMQIATNELRR